MLAAGRRAGKRRRGGGRVLDHLLAAAAGATAEPARIDLHHLVGAPVAERAPERIDLRDRRELQLADAENEAAHLAALAFERRAMQRAHRWRLLAIGDEHERRRIRQLLGNANPAVESL